MDSDQIKAAIEALKSNDGAAALQILEAALVSAAGGSASAPPPPDAASSEAADPVPPPPGEAPPPPKASALSKEFLAMQAQVTALTAERDEQDLAARQELVAELVKLGVETPATAWLNAEKRTPAKRFGAESVKELRARVAVLRAAKPTSDEIVPPVSGALTVASLTPAQLAACKKAGLAPEEFVTRLASAVKRA